MLSRTITCTNCGSNGEIEMHGLNGNISSSKIFRHLGHNPFSGHMHYQCPACEIVLLVDPMKVLAAAGLSLIPYGSPGAAAGKGKSTPWFGPLSRLKASSKRRKKGEPPMIRNKDFPFQSKGE